MACVHARTVNEALMCIMGVQRMYMPGDEGHCYP